MSNKKEKAREYAENILSPFYPMTDSYFNSYELEDAFEAGWDAACSEVGGENHNSGKVLNLRRKAYAKGKEDFLDKACKWLIECKEAVETEVKIDAVGYPYIPIIELYDYEKDVPLAKKGDKVKVIIIKEE